MVAALSVVEQTAELVEELERGGLRRKGQYICACYGVMDGASLCMMAIEGERPTSSWLRCPELILEAEFCWRFGEAAVESGMSLV